MKEASHIIERFKNFVLIKGLHYILDKHDIKNRSISESLNLREAVVNETLLRLKKILILELDLFKKKMKKKHEENHISFKESIKKEVEKTDKKLEEKLKEEQEKTKEYLNRLKYLQADFVNYRKRMEKVIHEATLRSNERLVACLIDIIDDLESAVSAGEKTENRGALLEGIKMVQKKFYKLLEKEGLERLECVGQPFDPNIHEVLAEVPTKEHESGTILEEARKGFRFKGKILRPSIVKIACKDLDSDKK